MSSCRQPLVEEHHPAEDEVFFSREVVEDGHLGELRGCWGGGDLGLPSRVTFSSWRGAGAFCSPCCERTPCSGVGQAFSTAVLRNVPSRIAARAMSLVLCTLALMMAIFRTRTLGVGGLMERVFFVEILAWYAWWSDGG